MKKASEARQKVVEQQIKDYADELEEIYETVKDKDEIFNKIIQRLYDVFSKACDFEEQNDDIQAVEQYFLCLGLIKEVMDSGIYHPRKDREYLREILTTFDLPCSIKMARIMFSTGNYDEVYVLSERVLAIDFYNEEARGYLAYIKKAEKNPEWRRVKDAKDIHAYIREYYAIQ